MIEDASREIAEGLAAAGRRRRGPAQLGRMVRVIDALLFQLEELNVQGVDRVPARLRGRVSSVLDRLPEPQSEAEREALRLRYRVQPLMDVLFDAQDLLLRVQDPTRAAFGEEEPEELPA